jgi:cytochrome c-type biogenesis protein CcmF
MGIGPLVAWRRASLRALGRMFLIPFGIGAVTGIALIAAGFGSSPPGLLAYTFSAFVLASIVLEFVRGRRAAGSIRRLVGRNRRRYGGYLVHAAIVLLAIGVAGSSSYETVREKALKPGQAMTVAGYTLTYLPLGTKQEANANATRATVDVSRGGSHVTTLHPGKNTYAVEKQTSNEVSIYHDPRNLGDVFLIADQIDPGSNTLYLKALVKPLVNLIWAAGFLFVFGALVAMWPDAVEQRRLADRYAAGAVAA